MQKLSRFARIDVAVAALVAGLASMPALAAAFPFDLPFTAKSMAMRDWILMGSLALLAIAVALRLLRHREERGHTLADDPDLRWWRNP